MKKSIVISLLTVTTLLCTALCSFASTGKVTTDTLRLREEASTESSTLALLSINDKVEILGEENGWYKVKFDGKVGYVAAQYISVLTNTNTNTLNVNEDTNSQNGENTEEVPEIGKEAKGTGETVKILVKDQKLYITPLINSLVINTLEEEKQIEVVSEINGWSYIKTETIFGWVRTENIQEKEVAPNTSNNENNNSSQKTGYISANSVNFRKTPNTSGEIITKLSRNVKVTIVEKGDSWVEVEYNGDRGYVSVDYISDKEIQTTSRGAVTRQKKADETNQTQNETKTVAKPEISESGVSGSSVISYAKQYLGYKYTSGGSSPSRGFDCSGFTTYVYKQFGIGLSRTSKGQAQNGTAVDKGNLAVGDIICFSGSRSSKNIGHVGIYVGGGKFIHSANSRQGVIISNVSGDGYYFVTARRVI